MTYFQQDSRWGQKLIENGPFNMAGSGCGVVSLCIGLNNEGITKDDPGKCLDKLNAVHAFIEEGKYEANLIWSKVHDAYPEVSPSFVSWQTDLKYAKNGMKPTDSNFVDMGTAIAQIKAAWSAGKIVILQVDLSPNNGRDEGDHFVCLKEIQGDKFIIQDPWFGWEGPMDQAHDGFANYGSPANAIYGYRILSYTFVKPITEHLNIPDYTPLQMAEGTGRQGLVVGGKIIEDDPAKMAWLFLVHKFGTGISMKDWNKFERTNLKGEKLT